eukprot:g34437.t1
MPSSFELIYPTAKSSNPNLTITLRCNPDLTNKPADKGCAVVVWCTELYIAEARCQLSDFSSYRPLDHDPTPDQENIISQTIHNPITSVDFPPTASNLIVPQPRIA